MRYLVGIDLGTSGTKTVLFDTDGKPIAAATEEYPLYQPQNGWAEQDPADWWDAVQKTMKAVLAKSGVEASDIAGVGISGQMHGLVMLDEAGRVLRKAILWCDGRTTRECAEITETVGRERLIAITANPALPGFTAGKILWVRRNEPDVYKQCRHVLLPKDYIRYMLTGVYATEASDASGMNLLDVTTRDWSDEMLQRLNIDPSWMSKVYESPDVTGTVHKQAAEATGLAEGTIVVGGAGDNAAGAVGMGVVREGRAFTSLGTSGVVFAHTDSVRIDPQGRVHTFCAAVPNSYTVMSCTLAAGLSLRWMRDTLYTAEAEAAKVKGVDPYIPMMDAAKAIPLGADRLLFLPYLMGERSPILDERSRGVFFGLSGIHTKDHMLRAVIEGISYSQRACVDVLRGMGLNLGDMLVCGGGGKSPFWRQMLADLYGCPVCTIESTEGPALGVAILAGVGAGVYPSVADACDRMIRKNAPLSPDAAASAAYEPYYQLYNSLYPVLKERFAALSEMK